MTAAPRTRRKPPEHQLLNHELGILAFNRRVLAQAEDRRNPILERLRFLCIVSSNLDEFFEIRVAELKERIKHGEKPSAEIFTSVSEQAHVLVAEQYRLLNDEVLPGLARHGVRFVSEEQWSHAQREWLHDYFVREMAPIITPIGLDPAHPFPRVLNKSLNVAVQLEGRDAFGRSSGTAIVQAPRVLPRIIRLPRNLVRDGACELVLLTWILEPFLGALFQSLSVKGVYPFRVTRNSDLFVEEEEIKDLRTALAGELPQRNFGNSVRLEVSESCPPEMTEFLLQQFELTEQDLYPVNGPVNLVRLMDVPDIANLPELKYASFIPSVPNNLQRHSNIFRAIAGGDILLHHPFQSFNPVIEMLEQAADDPNVVAIRQTVYRTGTDSVIMKYLIDAAQRGKEVTVVVELLARFDEEANIQYAAKLEEVGAHVVYGVVGYKIHAKMMLVTRREDGSLRRYAHLSTGNYHPRTAKQYTDFGLLTVNEEICADVDALFKQLTGLGRARSLHHLWVSPFTLHQRLIDAINREIRHAKAGKPAHVIAKMNSLLEPKVIEALYAASRAGVKVDLIVRGVCALRPGIPGLSEHIRVRSIIGRFLEHTRIFYFLNDGAEDVHLSSADWMERNFFRRIELCFPLLDPKLKQRVIKEGLKAYLADNNHAWNMDSNGNYNRRRPRGRTRSAQEQLLALLRHDRTPDKSFTLFFGKTLPVFACVVLLALGTRDACAADPAPAEESSTARFQSTYIWQHKPGFGAAYSGPNSLVAEREKSYTFTTTAYLGIGPWRDGEIYFNPELTAGVPFSNLTGTGGFTNGEITRTAGPNPKVYRQRLFLRQTWNMGGGEEAVEADLNQLAGTVARNRFVLTAGNFSTLDVFDDNAYAKDPRAQFMNWGNMTYAAFDYAADARGYGWGFAGEWYRGDWALRFGRMTGPRVPNGLKIDYRIGAHYGDQAEIEHAHKMGDQPGKIRLLVWRNKAWLASFRDALNYGTAHPGDPDHQWIFQARNGEKFKYGVGINIEQALGRDLGAFMRAMTTDGRTETYAFTEVDASFAAGLLIKGAPWHRAQDTMGLSVMRNALSADRRQYLQAGGISFFIGDGALRYRPETLFEGYYSLNMFKGLWLTADYQRIHNPAYNADRGPVNFYNLRVHAEF